MEDNLDYSWTQTSGQGVDLQDDNEEQAHFRAPQVNDDDSLRFDLRVEDESGRADEDSVTVNVNDINSNSDNLPCVQTYDTAHGTYVTDCDNNDNGNNGNGNLPILPPCQPGSINPNCKPVPPPPCKPGSTNPTATSSTPYMQTRFTTPLSSRLIRSLHANQVHRPRVLRLIRSLHANQVHHPHVRQVQSQSNQLHRLKSRQQTCQTKYST